MSYNKEKRRNIKYFHNIKDFKGGQESRRIRTDSKFQNGQFGTRNINIAKAEIMSNNPFSINQDLCEVSNGFSSTQGRWAFKTAKRSSRG